MNQKFAIYSRGLSCEQFEDCARWSAENLVPVEVFREAGQEWREFDRMHAEIIAGRIGGVIVWDWRQLARTVEHTCGLLTVLLRDKAGLVVVSHGIDMREGLPANPELRKMFKACIDFGRSFCARATERNPRGAGRKPREQTLEQAAAVAAHYAQHGATKHRDLAKMCGVDYGCAGRWVKRYAAELSTKTEV